jgi:hypothetical protein
MRIIILTVTLAIIIASVGAVLTAKVSGLVANRAVAIDRVMNEQ